MLSPVGWISGASATGVVIVALILGIYIVAKSRKTNANLLLFIGLTIIFSGLLWFGNVVDFLTIIITGRNLDNSTGLVGILSMMWLPFSIICAIHVGSELLFPKYKMIAALIYMILAITYEYFLFFDTLNSFEFIYPSVNGEDLIDGPVVFTSIVGILMIVFLVSAFICWGLGFMVKAFQSTDDIRFKFMIMSISIIMFILCAMLDGMTNPGIGLIFVRLGGICSFWFMYLGFFRYLGIKK